MPVMDLGDWGKGIDGYTCIALSSYMFHPNDSKKRNESIAKNLQNAKIKAEKNYVSDREKLIKKICKEGGIGLSDEAIQGMESRKQENIRSLKDGFERIIDTLGGEKTLLNSPSYDDVLKQYCEKSKAGIIVGNILTYIMRLENHGGSFNKSNYMTGKLFGDTGFSVAKKTRIEYWVEYKSVAHLWAAFVPSLFDLPGPNPAIPEHLPEFFWIADKYRKFGEEYHAPRAKKNTKILDGKKTWKIPTGFPTDKIDGFNPLSLSDDELKLLEQYEEKGYKDPRPYQ